MFVRSFVLRTAVPRGWDNLRAAIAYEILLKEAVRPYPPDGAGSGGPGSRGLGPRASGARDQARSSAAPDGAESARLTALVELARDGDAEAFGLLYDHYNGPVYRFLYYRLRSTALAEDLTSETFFRALRSISSFQWQGKDFGAWLMTIARNLVMDHFKSAHTRRESATEDLTPYAGVVDSPETAVLESLTNEALLTALRQLPDVQQECLVLRFLQGMSVAETARALGRSEGAVKQLQLRAVRSLAKLMPEEEP